MMNSSMIKGTVLGAAAVLAIGAGAVTGYSSYTTSHYADVVAVDEIKESVRTPREECKDVAVRKPAPTQDQNRIAGTVIGGLVGGLVGHQIGRGNGNTIATVAGAAAGGYAGNSIQKQMQSNDAVTQVQKQCTTSYSVSQRVVGYDVTYRVGNDLRHVRMDEKPGKRIPIVDGKPVSPTRREV